MNFFPSHRGKSNRARINLPTTPIGASNPSQKTFLIALEAMEPRPYIEFRVHSPPSPPSEVDLLPSHSMWQHRSEFGTIRAPWMVLALKMRRQVAV